MVYLKTRHLNRTHNVAEAVSMPITEGRTESSLKAMDAIAPITIPTIQAIMMLGRISFTALV